MSTQEQKSIISKWHWIAGAVLGVISWLSYGGAEKLGTDTAFALGELLGSILLITLAAVVVGLLIRWVGRTFTRKGSSAVDNQVDVPVNGPTAADKQQSKRSGLLQRIWPTITDKESARDAVVYGFGWYIFSLVVTALVAIWAMVSGRDVAGFDGWSLVDAAMLAIISWRVWKNSRAWAVTGLVYESLNLFYRFSESQGKFIGILPFLIYFAAISSVRGSFAFHKYAAPENGEKPSDPDGTSVPAGAGLQNITTTQISAELTGIVPERLKSNSFRILRLPSKASLADVHRAAGDMRRAAVLGTIVTTADDVPALGDLSTSEAGIRAAVGRIENPELRILDRLFWFHSDKASIAEKKTFIAHDLALKELFEAFTINADHASIEKWSEALRLWLQIVSDDSYWAQISELELEGGFEPAAFPSEIEELRNKAVELAAEPLVIAGRTAIERNGAEIARQILATLGALADTGSWAQSAELEIVAGPMERFKSLCKSIDQEFRDKVVREQNATQQNQAICVLALSRYRSDIEPELKKLMQLLPTGSEAAQECREQAALLLSGIAIDFTWADDYIQSEKLQEEAHKLAEDTLGAIRIQAALEKVRSSAQQQRVMGKPLSSAPSLYMLNGCGTTVYGRYDYDPATKSYTTIYYFTLLFLPILPLASYRVVDGNNGGYHFLGKLPLGKGARSHLGIVLSAVAIALVIAMVSSSNSRSSYSGAETTPTSSYSSTGSSTVPDSSSTTTSTYAPSSSSSSGSSSSRPSGWSSSGEPSSESSSYSSRSTDSNSELNELRRKIEAGRSEMKEIDARLKPVTDELDSINNQLKPLKDEMDALKQEHDAGTEVDVDHYNSLVRDYNSLVRRQRALFSENQSHLDRYESLHKEDESLLRQWKQAGGTVE